MNRLISLTAFAALFMVAQAVSAAIIWDFGIEFSGSGGSLSGTVQVTVDDGGGTGVVDVTVDATGLLDGSLSEYISGLYMNLDPAINPATLNWVAINPQPPAPQLSGVSLGADAHKADGDGYFDIKIDWDNQTFNAGETDMVTFSLLGLVEENFDFMSASGGEDSGPFVAALRARSLGEDGENSGWFYPEGGNGGGPPSQIPEPNIVALLGAAFLGLFLIRRRVLKQPS